MISDFIKYLEVERRYSPYTIVSYKTDLTSFLDFHQFQDYKSIERNHVRAWIIELSDSGISNKSINRKISSLKSYFKFLLMQERIEVNPTIGIVSPKIGKKLPEFVPEKDLQQKFDLEFDQNTHPRIKAIIELFYQTGIRLSELINLKRSNVTHNEIKVLGKRNKERIIPISTNLSKVLIDWQNYSEKQVPQNLDSQHYFFLTDKGKKLYSKFVYRLVQSYLSSTTTIQKKSPHVLRHTFATHMLNNGAEIESVKELLGHSSLSATQVYTHNSISRLKNAYKKAHPRG